MLIILTLYVVLVWLIFSKFKLSKDSCHIVQQYLQDTACG